MVKAVVEYENEKEQECMNLNVFNKKTGERYRKYGFPEWGRFMKGMNSLKTAYDLMMKLINYSQQLEI